MSPIKLFTTQFLNFFRSCNSRVPVNIIDKLKQKYSFDLVEVSEKERERRATFVRSSALPKSSEEVISTLRKETKSPEELISSLRKETE